MNSPRSCIGHGGWEHLETCPHTQHDTKAAAVLATHLRQGDLLLADRAFCSYELIVRSLAQGAHILMRLHQARARSLDWRKGKRLSSHERLVTCHRPQQPRGSSLTREEWNALPATLELRLIKLGYENRAGQKGEQPVWHLSFKGVLDLVVASHESFRAHAGRPRKRAEAFASLIETCATKQIDLRPFRSEPRAVKRRPKSYQLLTGPRGRFQEIHHRSRYRKSA